ncbi:MAG TPA: hypothetical protein VLK59_13715, partial [Solirubrobacteraceae bacterium]|nr:hypothetical protein [Solirubrobacteraceae bacterium]
MAHTQPPPQANCVGLSSRAIVVVLALTGSNRAIVRSSGLATHTAPAAMHTPLGLLPSTFVSDRLTDAPGSKVQGGVPIVRGRPAPETGAHDPTAIVF